jgi:hypothetical protein
VGRTQTAAGPMGWGGRWLLSSGMGRVQVPAEDRKGPCPKCVLTQYRRPGDGSGITMEAVGSPSTGLLGNCLSFPLVLTTGEGLEERWT